MGSFRAQPGGDITATVTPCLCRGGERWSRTERDPEALWDGSPWEHPAEQPRSQRRETPPGWEGAGSSLGLEAGQAGPRERQGPAVVQEGTWGRIWHLAPCPAGREDRQQAGLRAGHAEGLQECGSRGLSILRSWGRVRSVPAQAGFYLPVLCWVPKAQHLPKFLWHFGKCPLQTLGLLSAEVLNSPGAQAVTQVSPH